MSDTQDTILDILRKAYQIEVNGYTFYSMVSDKAKKPAVGELFEKLARDEVEHQTFLRDVAKGYAEEGTAAFRTTRRAPEMRAFLDTVFTERFTAQAQGAHFELGALSIGMQLEQNAITYFSRAAKEATDQEVRDFYTFLADWERQHYDALSNLFRSVREDFWSDGGFSPF